MPNFIDAGKYDELFLKMTHYIRLDLEHIPVVLFAFFMPARLVFSTE